MDQFNEKGNETSFATSSYKIISDLFKGKDRQEINIVIVVMKATWHFPWKRNFPQKDY